MASTHANVLREAMRARAQWHEQALCRGGGDPLKDPEEVRRHRELAVQWRRLELRLFGLSGDDSEGSVRRPR